MNEQSPNREQNQKRLNDTKTIKSITLYRSLLKRLTFIALGMFGFAFVFTLVQSYDAPDDAMGKYDKTLNTPVSNAEVLADDTRIIQVEFLVVIPQSARWQFYPERQKVVVHPGQPITINFHAKNNSQSSRIAQAIPSVSPIVGSKYFNKIECFCFNHQPLTANTKATLPLRFYIDRELPRSITTLTLTYTLYDITEREALRQKEKSLVMASYQTVIASAHQAQGSRRVKD